MAAWCYSVRQATRAALELGRDDAIVLSRAGHALVDVVHEFEAGQRFIKRALSSTRTSPPLGTPAAGSAPQWARARRINGRSF
jgi:hypothetical protein